MDRYIFREAVKTANLDLTFSPYIYVPPAEAHARALETAVADQRRLLSILLWFSDDQEWAWSVLAAMLYSAAHGSVEPPLPPVIQLGSAVEIWLIHRRTRKRIRGPTLAEVLALRALKRGRADAEQEALCGALLKEVRENNLWFECHCRRVGSQYRDFYGRDHGKGRYTLANRSRAPVKHAPDCVFRHGDADADRPPPAHHPDVLAGFGAAGEESPPPVPAARPWTYWKPRPRTAAEQEKTLWGTASILMQTARLNLLALDSQLRPPADWLADIAKAAERLYLRPRVPASGFLFVDPAALAGGRAARRLSPLAGAGGARI